MRLADVRRYALALEAVTEEPHHDYTSFRVRGKIFATAPPDGEHLYCFVPAEQQDLFVAVYPAFSEKLLWGHKALGVRLKLAQAPAAVVKQLVQAAYDARVAKDAGPGPKRTRARKPAG